jgi:hypothetical protein
MFHFPSSTHQTRLISKCFYRFRVSPSAADVLPVSVECTGLRRSPGDGGGRVTNECWPP